MIASVDSLAGTVQPLVPVVGRERSVLLPLKVALGRVWEDFAFLIICNGSDRPLAVWPCR